MLLLCFTEKSGVRSAVKSSIEEVTNDENDARLLYTSKHLLLYSIPPPYNIICHTHSTTTTQDTKYTPDSAHTVRVECTIRGSQHSICRQFTVPPKSRAQKKLSHPKTITRQEGLMCRRRESVFSLMVSR